MLLCISLFVDYVLPTAINDLRDSYPINTCRPPVHAQTKTKQTTTTTNTTTTTARRRRRRPPPPPPTTTTTKITKG